MNFDRAFGRLIWFGAFVANFLVFSLAAFVIFENHQDVLGKADKQAENYARVLEQDIGGFIRQIDITLHTVIEEMARHPAPGLMQSPAFLAFLGQQQAHIPDALGIRIADAEGRVVGSTSGDLPERQSIADRSYFKRLRDEPGAGLVISDPLFGRTSQRPIIVLARRINRADGSFAGTVHVDVAITYFLQRFSALDLGRQGNSGLWTRNTLIARYSEADPDGANSGKGTPSPQLRTLLDSDQLNAGYRASSGIDGVSRIYRFHRIAPHELFLLVGLADEEILAEWKGNAAIILGLVLLFSISSLVFARLTYAGWQKREADRARLDELNTALALRNQEAEAARQKVELILASAGEGVVGVDAEGTIIFINDAARDMLGWAEGEGIGADLHALTHHHHADGRPFPADECPIAATLRDGQTRRVADDCYWRRDGSPLAVEYTVAALLQDGKPGGAVNVFRDISVRKQNEAELAAYRHDLESLVAERSAALSDVEARASHLLESSAAGLFGIDRRGLITFINPAACDLLGYTAEHVIGQSAHQLFHHSRVDGSSYPVADCPSYLSLEVGRRVRVDNEVYWHADGHAISVSYATHPMVKNGEIIGAVTSFIDTSEQRAASEAREQALIEAEKLARIRSEFLANMSHEIRTPLNGVLGFANIGLRNSGNPEKAQASFSKILASGQHLLGVINDILDFSKIEAGKFVIEQTEVCLGDVIRQTCDMLAGSIEAKQLALKLDIAPDLPPVCISDPLRIGQVLLNILSNAVKFTESGSVALSVAHDGQAVFFAVSDSGIGMNDEQVGQLFTPFHQADASASRRFGGTGLGLAISKRILDLMGGAISVESRLGVGSTFRFQVPLHLPPAEPGAGQEQAASQAAHDDKPLAGLSILVAEDEPINQMILADNLAEDGANVVMVGNGQEALDRIVADGAEAYDIVLMDLQMPAMDGYEATRRILALAPDLPIVAQTAHALEEEREKCRAAGMAGHIAKPIDPDELVLVVRQHARPGK